jgi:uncharacterized protein YjiS (DUF1127 family)
MRAQTVSTHAAGNGTLRAQAIVAYPLQLWQRYLNWQARRATLLFLRQLDDRTLNDIGLQRSDIELQVGAAFDRWSDHRLLPAARKDRQRLARSWARKVTRSASIRRGAGGFRGATSRARRASVHTTLAY